MLDYSDGVVGQFFVSFRSAFSTNTVIHGSQGQLYITHPFTNPDACKAYIRKGNTIESLDVPRQYLYSGEVEAMHDYVETGVCSAVTIGFSKNVLETILKVKK